MSGQTKKGTGSVGGIDFDFTAVNWQQGRAPTSVWIAVPCDEDPRAHVAVVGVAQILVNFAERLKYKYDLLVGVGMLKLPQVTLGASVLGTWPAHRAEDIVRFISRDGQACPDDWASAYNTLRPYPEHKAADEVDEPLAKALIEIYIDQCIRATAN